MLNHSVIDSDLPMENCHAMSDRVRQNFTSPKPKAESDRFDRNCKNEYKNNFYVIIAFTVITGLKTNNLQMKWMHLEDY